TNRKFEIIAVFDAIDEATSDNYQVLWSYLPNEIKFNYKFDSMVRPVLTFHNNIIDLNRDDLNSILNNPKNKKYLKEKLVIDFDSISKISKISNNNDTNLQTFQKLNQEEKENIINLIENKDNIITQNIIQH